MTGLRRFAGRRLLRSVLLVVFLLGFVAGWLFLLGPSGGDAVRLGLDANPMGQATDPHCGPASLYFICEADGRRVPLRSLRDLVPHTVTGTTLLDLKKAAIRLGFDVDARRTTLRLLRKHLTGPARYAILHVDGNHFVAVLGTSGADSIRIADSSRGIGDMDKRAFRHAYRWDGAALLLTRVDRLVANEP